MKKTQNMVDLSNPLMGFAPRLGIPEGKPVSTTSVDSDLRTIQPGEQVTGTMPLTVDMGIGFTIVSYWESRIL